MDQSNQHYRRSIRLKEYDYTGPGWYFVTICTQDKKCWLGQIIDGQMILNRYGWIVKEEWLKTERIRQNVELDEYVIMPNHFHGILIITDKNVGATRRATPTLVANSLGAIIGQFKSVVTKRIRKMGLLEFRWQRNYYEHIIRNDRELYMIRQYIRNNPMKWDLDKYFIDTR